MAPGEKFRSRITLLQLSTGKVTPHGYVIYQFGETSYSILDLCFFVSPPDNVLREKERGPGEV